MKLPTRSFIPVIAAVILVSLYFHIRHYEDFGTNLLQGSYVKVGASDLVALNWSVPVVYDWDSDGRKDLLVGHNFIDGNGVNHGYVSFYRNAGSDRDPSFTGFTYLQSCSDTCAPLNAAAFG